MAIIQGYYSHILANSQGVFISDDVSYLVSFLDRNKKNKVYKVVACSLLNFMQTVAIHTHKNNLREGTAQIFGSETFLISLPR
jgi:hypothetical protein